MSWTKPQGLNYRSHAAETGKDLPRFPVFAFKNPASSAEIGLIIPGWEHWRLKPLDVLIFRGLTSIVILSFFLRHSNRLRSELDWRRKNNVELWWENRSLVSGSVGDKPFCCLRHVQSLIEIVSDDMCMVKSWSNLSYMIFRRFSSFVRHDQESEPNKVGWPSPIYSVQDMVWQ